MGIGKWISGVFGKQNEEPAQEYEVKEDGTHANNTEDVETKADNFLYSLMVLASYVIQADGKIMRSEMECARKVLEQGFSEERVKKGEEMLHRMFSFAKHQGNDRYKQTIVECCHGLTATLDYGGRLQLLSFLVQIARADRNMETVETEAISDIAMWLQIQGHELHTLFYLNGDTLEDAYNLLDVSPQATDDEVLQAFDKLAQQHRPDLVTHLGEDALRGARQKYQQIVAAKDRIMDARRKKE